MDLLAAVGTLWGLFGLVLFLPLVGAPSIFRRAAAILLTLQFVALLASGYGVTGAYVLASVDLPLLTFVFVGTLVAHGLRRTTVG